MKERKAEILLTFITIGWGSSYMFMKLGLNTIAAYNLIGLRFGIAFVVVLPLLLWHKSSINKKTLQYGSILGVLLFLIFALLLEGLKTTSTANAGFLLGLTVVFVPVIELFILKTKPDAHVMMSVVVAIIGISILTLQKDFKLLPGDLLCLLSAIVFASHIYITDKIGKIMNPLPVGILQLGVASIMGFIVSSKIETLSLPQSTIGWFAILSLALVCSAFGFVGQAVAQQHTTPARTGLIFSLQPIAALFFSVVFLNEHLGGKELLGASLILISVLISSQKKEALNADKRVILDERII